MKFDRKRLWIVATLGVLALVLTLVFGFYAQRERTLPMLEDVLPQFSELPTGARGPEALVFGVKVGFSTFAEVKTMLENKGLTCKDTSVRAMLQAQREAKRQEIAHKKGDAVTGASLLTKRSSKENNPQIRWSCEGVASTALGDRQRPTSIGRLLYIFDSSGHPLRSASYRRSQRNPYQALRDFNDSAQTMGAVFGVPSTRNGQSLTLEEARGMDKLAIFPKFQSRGRIWTFVDIEAKVTAINLGGRGISILESVEVPWPVRSDAPAL